MVCNSAKANQKRGDFYQFVQRMPINEALSKISPITERDWVIEYVKKILYKMHLIKAAKRLKRKNVIEISEKNKIGSSEK